MKKISFLILAMSLLQVSFAQQKFFVDLNNRADDLFKVTLIPDGLTASNNIFQFASTAPGTYQKMDIGRYVRSFKAFEETGKEIECKQIQTNQWEVSNPEKTKKIIYTISETWDAPVTSNNIYAMCGTSLENDHAVINGQAVFGYFHGKQKDKIEIKLDYPADWTAGTSLPQNANGVYTAKNYDEVVDSPIMLGKLTKAQTKIENTTINIYTYSKTGKISSENILILLEDMLNATSQFTQGLPVDNYTFLFHFENFGAGAWEHNYSSFYVFPEMELNDFVTAELKSTAAHEFYHVVTPLNIHSELVENFNYEKPTMSQHIWFYEGVTEWASDMIQLRDYLITLDEYLKQLKSKLSANDNYDQSISLTELSLKSTELQDQYPNIYMKGAVVAGLLDIRLLKLSNGKTGLREVINQLYKDYGANKSFSEKDFFDEIVKRTFPEVEDFFNRYVKGTEKLPIAEYYSWIGIDYKEVVGVDSSRIALGFGIGMKEGKFIVTRVDNYVEDGIRTGDSILKVNGEEVNMQNAQSKFAFMSKMKVGESFTLTVVRDGDEEEVKVTVMPRVIKHELKISDNADERQLELRSAWMQNL